MAKSLPPIAEIPMPQSALWDGPMAWVGSPPRPAACYAVAFPADAVFVRGEVRLTVGETVGPGMTRQTERAVPGLIRLDRGTPAEVSLSGPDGRCWTYRRVRTGRRVRWHLFAGATFPGAEPVGTDARAGLERAVVQSTLPMAGTGRYVSFAIDDEGRVEDFSAVTDPDPDD
ncbi:MAG: hypothetical protein ACRC1K_11770 [Planctomycetia bacterium]